MPNPTITRASVVSALTDIFHDVFEDERLVLTDALTARDVPLWDSMNHINLVIAVEQKFKVKFNAAEVARMANVGEFVDAIMKKAAA